MNIMKKLTMLLAFAVLLWTGCKDDDDKNTITFSASDTDIQTKVQEALITASAGTTLHFNAGTYQFTSTLSLDNIDNITIEGAGRDNTILSFANQTAGAEGIKVTNANNFIIRDLTVSETEGDAIKTKDCDGVVFYNVAAIWNTDGDENNGAYGLYPVNCFNVLIDGCLARGASDAGIYVGQTDRVIVRNSRAEKNVAGIEIENTTNADVYDNTSTNNTGGILIFDLPGLLVNKGGYTRIYNNTVEKNDHANFAPEGNIVGEVPVGTGIMVLSTSNVEIFDNDIRYNNVMGVGVVSYLTTQRAYDDADYEPYPSEIYIHDNNFLRTNELPQNVTNTFGVLFNTIFSDGNIEDILFDGVVKTTAADAKICIKNNGTAGFMNLDAAHFFAGRNTDITPHDCIGTTLPAATITVPSLD